MAKPKKPARVAKKVLKQLAQVTTPTITTQLMKSHGLHNTSMVGVLPIDPELPAFAGPAYTLRYVPLREDLLAEQWLDHPNNLMTPAVEEIPEGAVMVMDTGGRTDVGILGGNILMRLKVRGIAGAVTDGGMRDIPEIEELGFPVCAGGSAPPPSFAKLMLVELGGPVVCGGVPVFPGDIIVGDSEGVVAVPAAWRNRWPREALPRIIWRVGSTDAWPRAYLCRDCIRPTRNTWPNTMHGWRQANLRIERGMVQQTVLGCACSVVRQR